MGFSDAGTIGTKAKSSNLARHVRFAPQSGYRSDLKVIALLDHLSCMTPMSSSRNRPANQPTPSADLKPRHHLGRGGGGAIVGGTFENHAVSKTCLAIC